MTDGDGIPRMDTSDVQYSRNGIRKLGVRLTPVHDGLSPAPQIEAKPDQLQVNYITYKPHDRVRGRHYPESGGKSRTAYIISQRNEIEGLRAAGAYVYVDADIMEAALQQFIWSSVAGHYHHHDRHWHRAGVKPVHDDLSPAPQPEAEPDKQPSSTAYTDLEAAFEPLAAAACSEVDSEEAAFWLLISELEGCDLQVQSEFGALQEASCACTFSCLPVADRKCGKKKKKQKLNSKEALPSKEAYSGFNVSSVQRFAVPRKRTMPSRDMAVGISSSSEFMQPLVLTIIMATHYIVLAIKDCAVLSTRGFLSAILAVIRHCVIIIASRG
jgi:hypothetical protein